METKVVQWRILVSCVLSLILINSNNAAFALRSTTPAAEEAANNKYEHINRIMKSGRSSVGEMQDASAFSEQVVNLIADSSESSTEPSSDQPKPLTYKDLCKILGDYQIRKESNHYEVNGARH